MSDKRAEVYRKRQEQRRAESAEKKLARAHRSMEAQARIGWEDDYGGAIEAVFEGDASRLVDLLRARRPLTAEDHERLADYIELTTRGRGAPPKTAAREAARLAEALLDKAVSLPNKTDRPPTRDEIVEYACESVKRTTGEYVGPDEVKDLLRRPRRRRQ